MAGVHWDERYDEVKYTEALKKDFTIRAGKYDVGESGTTHWDFVETLLSLYPFEEGPVLDIACGTGLLAARVADAGGGPVSGLDVTPAMLDVARRSCPAGTFVVGRAEKLPFEDNSFASAYICCALVYFTNVPAALREAYRVVKPGGFLAYQAVSADSYVVGVMQQEACDRALGKEVAKKTFQVPSTITDTPEDNVRLMEAAGFSQVHVEERTEFKQLALDDADEFWRQRVMGSTNALSGRMMLLDDVSQEKVRNEFVSCVQERRCTDGTVNDMVRSWYVWGRKGQTQ